MCSPVTETESHLCRLEAPTSLRFPMENCHGTLLRHKQCKEMQSSSHVHGSRTGAAADRGTRQSARTGVTNPRDSHSLAYKKFQDFSRTFQEPKNIFLNSVVAQQCTDRQQLLSLSLYIYTHYSVTVQSTAKCSSQITKKLFG